MFREAENKINNVSRNIDAWRKQVEEIAEEEKRIESLKNQLEERKKQTGSYWPK